MQALAFATDLNELPAKFIRPAHERPENTKPLEGLSVPVISLAKPRDVLVKEIYEAATEWGVFLLENHGIPPPLIAKLQEVGSEFFKQPPEEKEKYANDPSSGKFEGYGTKMTKNHDEKVEWVDYFFHLMSPTSKVNYQIWPQVPSSYRYILSRLDPSLFLSGLFSLCFNFLSSQMNFLSANRLLPHQLVPPRTRERDAVI